MTAKTNPLPAPLPDCRFAVLGSKDHEFFLARGWRVSSPDRPKAGDVVVMTKEGR